MRKQAPVGGRLFVAIELDEPAKDYIANAIERLRAAGLAPNYIPREKWHVTLAFLGPVDKERRADVVEALKAAVRCMRRFDLALDTVGAFPTRKRPRVVWVGSSEEQPAFAACAAAVRKELTSAGFTFDNDAVPHVTVCRLKHHAAPLPDVALERGVTVPVEGVTLYESIPAGRTTKYVPGETVRLQ